MAVTSHNVPTTTRIKAPKPPASARQRTGTSAAAVTLLPLGVILALFFLVPILGMLFTSLLNPELGRGELGFTLDNYAALGIGPRGRAMVNSIIVSSVSATVACVLGLVVTWALSLLRSKLLDRITGVISSVLANSGGAPLAFSFIVLVGNAGYLTVLLTSIDPSFTLYSVKGLVLMYQYFLIPTVVLLTLPAFNSLQDSWREANTSLGGSGWTFWRRVGVPLMLPAIIGAWVLLFGAAFATHASAAVLMGTGAFPLVTLQIANELAASAASGGENVAMAMGIATTLIATVTLVVFNALQRRGQRWLQTN